MTRLFQAPRLSTGTGFNRAKVVKGDSLFIKFRVSGDLSAASLRFAARIKSDPMRTVVISKSSSVNSEIYIDQVMGQLYADCTLHISSADTSPLDVLEPQGLVLEYDIELTDTVDYGGTSDPGIVQISNSVQTLQQGTFTLLDQVII